MNAATNSTATAQLSLPRFGSARPGFGAGATEFLLRWREAQRVTRLPGRLPLYARGSFQRAGGRA